MATCPECKSEVPFLASRCKYCTSKLSPLQNVIIGAISLVILVGALFMLAGWVLGLIVSIINFPLVSLAKLFGYILTPSWWQTVLLLAVEAGAAIWIYKKVKSNQS